MKYSRNTMENAQGYILVVTLLIMAILSLIGIAGMNTSIFEMQIAGNQWNAKQTFYHADGGLSIGSEVLEQNFGCATGFTQAVLSGTITINDNILYDNPVQTDAQILAKVNDPVNTYDAAFPIAGGNLPNEKVGYLFFGGQTELLPGGALQMAAGYEGKGKSAAQGGVAKVFEVYSQYLGSKNSESILALGWRHLVGTEGSCIY